MADDLFERKLVDFEAGGGGLVLQGEIFGKQNWSGREYRGADQSVFQFAHIAGPRVILKQLLRFGGDSGNLQAHLAVDFIEEVADQEGNVAAPVAQRRQINRDYF